jgi:hypothetical protein
MLDYSWKASILTLTLVWSCGLDDDPTPAAGSVSHGIVDPTAGDASASARAQGNGADASNLADAISCPCTRRPEGEPSRLCPWGTCTYVENVIGPTGGVLQVRGTAATQGVPAAASIPGAALAANTRVVFTELTAPPPAGFVDYSPVYALEPRTLELSAPGAISLPGTNVDGIFPTALAVYEASSPEGPFTRIADSYTNAGFFQATLLHGGYYFVGYPEAERPTQCP